MNKIIIGCQKQTVDLSPYKIAGTNESIGFCGGIYAGTMRLCEECRVLQKSVEDKQK